MQSAANSFYVWFTGVGRMMRTAMQKLNAISSEQFLCVVYMHLVKLGFVRAIETHACPYNSSSIPDGSLTTAKYCATHRSGLAGTKVLPFSGCSNSVRCDSGATASFGNIPVAERSSSDKYVNLWYDLLSDPSQWWDNRVGKPNARFPDFKHKQTGAGLWLIDGRNPTWVASEIASIAPGLSIFSWAQKLSKYNKAGQYEETMKHFEGMKQEGVIVDGYIFVHVLTACAALQLLREGILIHKQIVDAGCELNLHVGSSLVDMYAKCGSIDEAWRVFNRMPTRDVVAWTAMILGYLKCGESLKALELFKQMQVEGIEPDSLIFVGALNACAKLAALEEGKRVHKQISQRGCQLDARIGNSLIDMYAKCGSIDDAWRVFSSMPTCDVVGWNAMILGYVKCEQGLKSLALFRQMQRSGVKPNSITFLGLLNACASMQALEEGRLIHKEIILSGCESELYIGNSLVDMYSKCGSIEDAWKVFDSKSTRDVVSWNAMILGCVKFGAGLKAIELFHQMQEEGVRPDPRTFVGVLNACASIAALEEGRLVHKQIIESGLEPVGYVGNSLVDMYAKCGSIDDARRVFNNMPACDEVGWNAMIMGYAMHGHAKEAVVLFEQMSLSGSKINEVTFICLLSAFSHGGLVKDGMQYFESMWPVYGVSPKQEHYTCIVDILGRAGHLEDAEEMIKTMPLEPCAAPWMSLLAACRIHGNVEMGKRASQRVLELDPSHSAGFVLLSNIYAAAGRWNSQATVQEQRQKNCAMKQPGRTWIEVNNKVHSFVVNDCEHPQIL